MIEQGKFIYSHIGKALKNKQGRKQAETLKVL